MSKNPATGPVVVEAANSSAVTPSPSKGKPSRTLPTDRINTAKQLDILRAYAAASSNGTRPASTNEVAEMVKMAPSTVSMANAFLGSIGLIQRSDAGAYMPSSDVIGFLRAHEWNPDTASHKLNQTFRDSWFGQALIPKITFGPMEEENAISVLAETATAGPDYRKELRMLLEFLAHTGVVIREAGQVKLAKASIVSEGPQLRQESQPTHETEQSTPKPGKNVQTALQSTDGGVTFNVSVKVDMAEFSTWRPERISAFFRGIAEVLAAKADVEKGSPTV